MLNRRNLRIKAMQTLFALRQLRTSDQQLAWENFKQSVKEIPEGPEPNNELEKAFKEYLSTDQEKALPAELVELAAQANSSYREQIKKDLKFLRSQMLKEVDGIHQLFLWVMNLLVALADFEEALYDRKKTKPSQPPILAGLPAIEIIRNKLEDDIPGWQQHQDRLSQWYREIKNAEDAPIGEEGGNGVDLLTFVFKSILWKSVSFQNFFEEYDRGWVENKDIIKSLVNKTLKSITDDDMVLAPLSYQWEDDQQFFTDIFDRTIASESDTEKLVAERAKNWDMDRIAQLDMVLLKMAITEMINFPSIPVKVTINEYIELSKKYSTPKSKKFINGILDVLANHLTDNGTIKKSGRGLIDNK